MILITFPFVSFLGGFVCLFFFLWFFVLFCFLFCFVFCFWFCFLFCFVFCFVCFCLFCFVSIYSDATYRKFPAMPCVPERTVQGIRGHV